MTEKTKMTKMYSPPTYPGSVSNVSNVSKMFELFGKNVWNAAQKDMAEKLLQMGRGKDKQFLLICRER